MGPRCLACAYAGRVARAAVSDPWMKHTMRHRTVIGLVAIGTTLAACGPSTPSTIGSLSSSVGAAPTATSSAPAPAPRASRREGPVFSGTTMLAQRAADSNSEDDPAAFRYRLQYSLNQIKTAETADPQGRPGFVRTQVAASATVFVTNMTPQHKAPLGDLSGVMLGGAYKFDRGICHQRHTRVANRGNYCFVSLWTSPDNPGELAVAETRELGDSSLTSWDIMPLARNDNDALLKDLFSPDLYFVASLSHGYYFVPKNHCTISFDLTTGHAILDTLPHVNVCAEG